MNFSEILIKIYTFSFTKMPFKMLSVKWRPFFLSLNVLTFEVPPYFDKSWSFWIMSPGQKGALELLITKGNFVVIIIPADDLAV